MRAPQPRFKEVSEIPEFSLGVSQTHYLYGTPAPSSWCSLPPEPSAAAADGQRAVPTLRARQDSSVSARAEETRGCILRALEASQ